MPSFLLLSDKNFHLYAKYKDVIHVRMVNHSPAELWMISVDQGQ